MKILFVCSGNAYRSVVAEALLRKARSDLDVDSAGTDIAIPISVEAKKYLSKENAEKHLKKRPEGLEKKRLNEYDLIVAMEMIHRDIILTECPECAGKILVWDIDDPYFLPRGYTEKIFNQIKRKVQDLATSM